MGAGAQRRWRRWRGCEVTQGSECLATLGFSVMSLWDVGRRGACAVADLDVGDDAIEQGVEGDEAEELEEEDAEPEGLGGADAAARHGWGGCGLYGDAGFWDGEWGRVSVGLWGGWVVVSMKGV